MPVLALLLVLIASLAVPPGDARCAGPCEDLYGEGLYDAAEYARRYVR